MVSASPSSWWLLVHPAPSPMLAPPVAFYPNRKQITGSGGGAPWPPIRIGSESPRHLKIARSSPMCCCRDVPHCRRSHEVVGFVSSRAAPLPSPVARRLPPPIPCCFSFLTTYCTKGMNQFFQIMYVPIVSFGLSGNTNFICAS
ncbi:hypothetical protein PVAP13_3NG234263 [Panicum virgatum]|uniref:Uncharacterized protein n=1 Tax=Panicum virgatum TaxID=38727 RepID=A0A8T0UE35_PANVG|nr:hypothetical protein PVAP13_3NG234263 [Panicum virgatum]